jgi:AcrR family transcriptional regulator
MRYEKGRKDVTRRRITDVASERFRGDGIAASGLAGIMSEAGLTNGAFYPHFESKAELVRESLAAALEGQLQQLRAVLDAGGLEAGLAAYLSPEHRDDPASGCASAALLPEIARQPTETRELYAGYLDALVRHVAGVLPPRMQDREAMALSIFAMLVGAMQLARAVPSRSQSDRILAAAADAALALVQLRHDAPPRGPSATA